MKTLESSPKFKLLSPITVGFSIYNSIGHIFLDQKQKYSLFGNTFEKLIFELETDLENLNEEKGPIKNDDVYLMIEGSKHKTEMHKKETFPLKKSD